MPIITDISPQQRKSDRFNVFIDGKFVFGLLEESVLRLELYVGKELTEAELAYLQKELVYDKVLFKAYTLLSYRPRSISELRTLLRERVPGASSETVDAVLEYFIEKKYLDDTAFATWWVQQRREVSSRFGAQRIRQELLRKGIAQEIIDAALHESKEDVSEAENAVILGRKLFDRSRESDPYKHKQKILQSLVRKGFSWEDAQEAYTRVLQEQATG